jgi:hypothetical protein
MVVTLLIVLVALVAYAIWWIQRVARLVANNDGHVLDRLRAMEQAEVSDHATMLAALREAQAAAEKPVTLVVPPVVPVAPVKPVAVVGPESATPAPPALTLVPVAPVVRPKYAPLQKVDGRQLIRARLALRQKKGKK